MTARLDAMPEALARAAADPASYCARCSPYGRPMGEPGEECCRCGQAIRMTPVQTAECRAARARFAALPRPAA